MLKIFEELNKFSNVIFHEDGHKYYIDGKEAISSTTLIGKYEKPFDEMYWSERKAPEKGMSPEEVRDMWKLGGEQAGFKGTKVHSYLENLIANKVLSFEEQAGVMMEDCGDVRDAYDKIVPMIHKFYDTIKGKLIPIRSEIVIGDLELLIAGMIDQLFFNVKSGKLELWDWKTNKKINTSSPYKLLKPLNKLSDSKLDVYSLQLSLYKYIIHKNTDLELGDSYICWFNEKNPKYKIFKCHDYTNEVGTMIKHYEEFS